MLENQRADFYEEEQSAQKMASLAILSASEQPLKSCKHVSSDQ